ncbi:MAG: hypothetical protein BHV68_18295 [Bacteroidales bacterium 43_8]|nr:MAG: hypothetical protein BHV68_18295 [Bacteroidales bacterium 43_8]
MWALPSYHCATSRNTYGIRQGERAKIRFEHFLTPPLCLVVKQNIGEVARSDGGVENNISSDI